MFYCNVAFTAESSHFFRAQGPKLKGIDFAGVGASKVMAQDLIAMGIGGWVGAALVIGYFHVQNVHFDLKTVAIACLLPFTVGICSEILYYILRMNSFLLGTMLLPEVIILTTTLMAIATITYVIYKERCDLRFLDVRDELRADTDESEGEEDQEEGQDEDQEEDQDEDQGEDQDENQGDETEFEDEGNEEEHNDDNPNHDHEEDSDDEGEDINETSESDEEEEVCIVTPPPAPDSRDIIAELKFADLPPLPS